MTAHNIVQLLASRELGGGELVALALADAFRARGETSAALIPGDGPAWSAAQRMRLDVGRYDLDGASARGRLRPALANGDLLRRLWRRKPGLVHVHAPHVYGALARALRWSGVRTVVHVHLVARDAGFEWAFREPPDLIVTCAKFFRDRVAAAIPDSLLARVRIEAVPNAVDVERFQPRDKAAARHRVGYPDDLPLMLMLANLAPHKGQETAIRAAAELKRRGTPVRCWLAGVERVGSNGYADRLRALAADAGVAEQVALLGYRDDTPGLLAAADVVLLPSTNEGLPLSLLEAQAAGTPVVAAPTAGIPEIIVDGETGFLADAGDVAAYADRVGLLLSEPSLARRLADQARRRVEREYTWEAYCGRILNLYEELLGDGSRSMPEVPSKRAHANAVN